MQTPSRQNRKDEECQKEESSLLVVHQRQEYHLLSAFSAIAHQCFIFQMQKGSGNPSPYVSPIECCRKASQGNFCRSEMYENTCWNVRNGQKTVQNDRNRRKIFKTKTFHDEYARKPPQIRAKKPETPTHCCLRSSQEWQVKEGSKCWVRS